MTGIDATRDALVSVAGIEAERLRANRERAGIGVPGAGRVEFEILAGN